MSWGYFVELDLRLPAAALAALKKSRPAEVELPPGWSGFSDRSLEGAFGRRITKKETFTRTLSWYQGEGSIQREDTTGDHTTLHVLTMLEKSVLDEAFPLAALFFAAREHGGEGTLRFVNDGTSGGEFGVELSVGRGTITSRQLEEDWELVGRLGEALYALPPASVGAVRINPFTGMPLEQSATKPARAKPKPKPTRR